MYPIFFVLFLQQGLIAQDITASNENRRFTLGANVGYTQQNFDWSIAGNNQGTAPNILSELKWKNVGGIYFNFETSYQFYRKIYANINYRGSVTVSGTATDTDYRSDNRTNVAFNVLLNSKAGKTSDMQFALGYQLVSSKTFELAIEGGYIIYKGEFSLTDLNEQNEADNERLNSKYLTAWQGIFCGLKPNFKIAEQINIQSLIQYSQLAYRAQADWNLIEQFQHPISFKHRANGYGLLTDCRINYKWNEIISIGLGASFLARKTGIGIDRLFLDNGEESTTRFNGADQKAQHIFIYTKFRL